MRHAAQRRRAKVRPERIDRQGGPPAEDLEAFVVGDGLDGFAGGGARGWFGGHEADAGGEGVLTVECRGRKFEVDDFAEQIDGKLDENAGTVAAVGLGAGGTAVVEVFEGDQPSTTMLCERRPLMSATMATPQESASLSGS